MDIATDSPGYIPAFEMQGSVVAQEVLQKRLNFQVTNLPIN